MEPIPLPSHIHYELLLQLLERQTMVAVGQRASSQQVHQLIITLRKALAIQKQLEEDCQRNQVPIEYRWSLNSLTAEKEITAKKEIPAALLSLPKE